MLPEFDDGAHLAAAQVAEALLGITRPDDPSLVLVRRQRETSSANTEAKWEPVLGTDTGTFDSLGWTLNTAMGRTGATSPQGDAERYGFHRTSVAPA